MSNVLRTLFFLLVVRPIILIVLGMNVRRRDLLPETGPAIIVANHNSHLDTLVLITLLGRKKLRQVRPVAAADYFLKNRLFAWFSLNIIGIIPIERKVSSARTDPLAKICEGIKRGEILILFPEGSRGEPETMTEFHNGVAHIVKRHPEVPVVPVFLHGLGKALPKGEGILVPFFVDVFVGESLNWQGDREQFMHSLRTSFEQLRQEFSMPDWT